MIVKLLTEHHLEFLSLKGGCTGSSESTLVKMPHCWKSRALAHIEEHAICLKDYRIRSFLSIQYVHRDLCKHLGIDSSTDHPDRYSNLFLNAYINR